jgi:hypothetical protein
LLGLAQFAVAELVFEHSFDGGRTWNAAGSVEGSLQVRSCVCMSEGLRLKRSMLPSGGSLQANSSSYTPLQSFSVLHILKFS